MKRTTTKFFTTTISTAVVAASALAALSACNAQQAPAATQTATASESMLLQPVQLTFADTFVKAGESYFSKDGKRVIFQGIPTPPEGEDPIPFYHMYVADVVYNDQGDITGLENYKQLSPEGSSNTCGWFHPQQSNLVMFGSTIIPPVSEETPGYQRGSKRYEWLFPREMNIVQTDLTTNDATAATLSTLIADDAAYLAECSLTNDGRHLLYCRFRVSDGAFGGDIWVKDLFTGKEVALVTEQGYDGGPFFSPDEKRICYRSDRNGDNYLQIFVGELEYDEHGSIVGLKREIAVTQNEHVNWCPFWEPDNRHLVYATSEVGHSNYEIFRIDVYPPEGTSCEATKQRVTNAAGFDGLPAFNTDASLMIWTSQRADGERSQLWCASYKAE